MGSYTNGIVNIMLINMNIEDLILDTKGIVGKGFRRYVDLTYGIDDVNDLDFREHIVFLNEYRAFLNNKR